MTVVTVQDACLQRSQSLGGAGAGSADDLCDLELVVPIRRTPRTVTATATTSATTLATAGATVASTPATSYVVHRLMLGARLPMFREQHPGDSWTVRARGANGGEVWTYVGRDGAVHSESVRLVIAACYAGALPAMLDRAVQRDVQQLLTLLGGSTETCTRF